MGSKALHSIAPATTADPKCGTLTYQQQGTHLNAARSLGDGSVISFLAMKGYASSTIAKSGSPTRAMPSSTEIARMIRAKYGGMRKGNLKVISARSAASSWKLMLFAPPPKG
jgi:hypothetical protein